jgi:hypothetical protein
MSNDKNLINNIKIDWQNSKDKDYKNKQLKDKQENNNNVKNKEHD